MRSSGAGAQAPAGRSLRHDRPQQAESSSAQRVARQGGAATQRAIERAVGHHLGKGLAGLDFPVEGEEDRTDGIGGARIGDDHVGDRLGFRREFLPAAEALQHAAGSRGNGRCAGVVLPDFGRRGVDDDDPQAWPGDSDRDRGGQADIAGAHDDDVEARVTAFSCRGFPFGHDAHSAQKFTNLDLPPDPVGNPAAAQRATTSTDTEQRQ